MIRSLKYPCDERTQFNKEELVSYILSKKANMFVPCFYDLDYASTSILGIRHASLNIKSIIIINNLISTVTMYVASPLYHEDVCGVRLISRKY
jgi:hypothetical protein